MGSVFHAKILKRELELIHKIATFRANTSKPLIQAEFKDEGMEIATAPLIKPKAVKNKSKGDKKKKKEMNKEEPHNSANEIVEEVVSVSVNDIMIENGP